MVLEFLKSIFNNISSWLDANNIATFTGYLLLFFSKRIWKKISKPKNLPTNTPTQISINNHCYQITNSDSITFNQNNQNYNNTDQKINSIISNTIKMTKEIVITAKMCDIINEVNGYSTMKVISRNPNGALYYKQKPILDDTIIEIGDSLVITKDIKSIIIITVELS